MISYMRFFNLIRIQHSNGAPQKKIYWGNWRHVKLHLISPTNVKVARAIKIAFVKLAV